MALVHVTAIRNTICDAVVDAIDAGAAAGDLVFQTSGDVEVARLAYSATAFGAAAGGTATANAISPDTDADGGTIAKFRCFEMPGNVEVFQGTVTVTSGGGDIELNAIIVSVGQEVSMTSFTYSSSA